MQNQDYDTNPKQNQTTQSPTNTNLNLDFSLIDIPSLPRNILGNTTESKGYQNMQFGIQDAMDTIRITYMMRNNVEQMPMYPNQLFAPHYLNDYIMATEASESAQYALLRLEAYIENYTGGVPRREDIIEFLGKTVVSHNYATPDNPMDRDEIVKLIVNISQFFKWVSDNQLYDNIANNIYYDDVMDKASEIAFKSKQDPLLQPLDTPHKENILRIIEQNLNNLNPALYPTEEVYMVDNLQQTDTQPAPEAPQQTITKTVVNTPQQANAESVAIFPQQVVTHSQLDMKCIDIVKKIMKQNRNKSTHRTQPIQQQKTTQPVATIPKQPIKVPAVTLVPPPIINIPQQGTARQVATISKRKKRPPKTTPASPAVIEIPQQIDIHSQLDMQCMNNLEKLMERSLNQTTNKAQSVPEAPQQTITKTVVNTPQQANAEPVAVSPQQVGTYSQLDMQCIDSLAKLMEQSLNQTTNRAQSVPKAPTQTKTKTVVKTPKKADTQPVAISPQQVAVPELQQARIQLMETSTQKEELPDPNQSLNYDHFNKYVKNAIASQQCQNTMLKLSIYITQKTKGHPKKKDIIEFLGQAIVFHNFSEPNNPMSADTIIELIMQIKDFFVWARKQRLYKNIAQNITYTDVMNKLTDINNDSSKLEQTKMLIEEGQRCTNYNKPIPKKTRIKGIGPQRIDIAWIHEFDEIVSKSSLQTRSMRNTKNRHLSLESYLREYDKTTIGTEDILKFIAVYKNLKVLSSIRNELYGLNRFFVWVASKRGPNHRLINTQIQHILPTEEEVVEFKKQITIINNQKIRENNVLFQQDWFNQFYEFFQKSDNPNSTQLICKYHLNTLEQYLNQNVPQMAPNPSDILDILVLIKGDIEEANMHRYLTTYQNLFRWTSLNKDENGSMYYPNIIGILPERGILKQLILILQENDDKQVDKNHPTAKYFEDFKSTFPENDDGTTAMDLGEFIKYLQNRFNIIVNKKNTAIPKVNVGAPRTPSDDDIL